MITYRMEVSATICFDVEANSEKEAIKKANKAIQDFSNGCPLSDGDDYSDAVAFASTEDSPEVVDVTEAANQEDEGEEARRTR